MMTVRTESKRLSRRSFLRASGLAVTATLAGGGFASGTEARRKVDVCIYGATSGGVIAAVALAKLGRSVLLVEPTRHVGGMTSGGLGWIDFGRASTIGGLTKQYFDSVRAYYRTVGITSNGWSVEPHVAEELFEELIARHKIELLRESRLGTVQKSGRLVRSITLDRAAPDSRGAPSPQAQERNFVTVEASMFIDATYEGDLLAAARVSFRTDRESRAEYGESLAGVCFAPPSTERYETAGGSRSLKRTPLRIDPFVRPGEPSSGLLPLISGLPLPDQGKSSPAVQSYTFRLCLTKKNPLPIAPPADYDSHRYELARRYIEGLEAVGEPLCAADLYFNFGEKNPRPHPRLLKITRLMRGKTDVNSGSGGISTDYVGGGAERYANANWAERAKIWRAHEDYQRGLFHFLCTDERLPDWLRKELSNWGLPKDEFRDTGAWPWQLYIREARRMVGSVVVDQKQCEHPGATETPVGLGSYSLDSHICQRLVKDGAVLHEGGFYSPLSQPYPIPYGAIVPREEECENLLVTFCVSSTHVAFASVRMEPASMILSESAAFAADQALQEGSSVQRINREKLRKRLADAGQVL
jgi:hypothetical protein